MNIGKSCGVFEQINTDKYTEQEKLSAIKQVIEMPTHNGITKDCILNAFKWFFNWAVEKSSSGITNADCIRAMSDEEIADFILKNCDNPISEVNEDMCDFCSIFEEDKGCDSDYCKNALLKWLQSEVEE